MTRPNIDEDTYCNTWQTVERWADRKDLPTWKAIEHRGEARRLPRAIAWASLAFPGIVVRHCGHPTAVRPYYIEGLDVSRKFTNLAYAQAAVAAIAAGAIKEENL